MMKYLQSVSFNLVCCDEARAPVFWVSVKKDELARNRLITCVVEGHVELCKKFHMSVSFNSYAT